MEVSEAMCCVANRECMQLTSCIVIIADYVFACDVFAYVHCEARRAHCNRRSINTNLHYYYYYYYYLVNLTHR